MNSQRLMEDIKASVIGRANVVRPNISDASTALACNLITNVLGGDLSDHSLQIFLDKKFLTFMLQLQCQPHWLGQPLPLLLHSLMYLRSTGTPEDHLSDVGLFHTCLLDMHRAALPTGVWDDVLLAGQGGESLSLLDIVRPDVYSLSLERAQLDHWIASHGFNELPLARSSLRGKVLPPVGSQARTMTSLSRTGLLVQQISSSVVPQPEDLFFHKSEFDRWICVSGAMLIYKHTNDRRRLHDKRWLKKSTTIAIKRHQLNEANRVIISLGALSGAGNFDVTIHTGMGQEIVHSFKQVESLTCELHIQKWVDATRITIDTASNYAAQLELH